jgi:hypothetical protein
VTKEEEEGKYKDRKEVWKEWKNIIEKRSMIK